MFVSMRYFSKTKYSSTGFNIVLVGTHYVRLSGEQMVELLPTLQWPKFMLKQREKLIIQKGIKSILLHMLIQSLACVGYLPLLIPDTCLVPSLNLETRFVLLLISLCAT